MAKQTYTGLAPETLLDIVAIGKTDKNIESIFIIEMTVRDWQNIKKKPNFIYRAYQQKFHSFKKT